MVRSKYYLVLLDLALAFFCLLWAYPLRFLNLTSTDLFWQDDLFALFFFILVLVFSSYFFELYDLQKFVSWQWFVWRCGYVFFTAFFQLSAIFYLIPSVELGRGLLIIALALFFMAQVVARVLVRRFSQSSQFASRILIAGAGTLAQKIYDVVPEDSNIHSYVRFVACTKKDPVVDSSLIVGHRDNIREIVLDYQPQKLIVALSERRGNLPLKELMQVKLRGVDIIDATTYYERVTGCLLVEDVQPSAFVYNPRFRMTPFLRGYKRLYDLFFSLIGLLLAAPVLPIIAVLVKLDSPGPIFFKQLRVGENEVEYFIYKFRTMTDGAENETGAVWAQKNDPRVTKLGRFMRKTRLDEIPQLYNVLKGDMSFIGPRPERMAFVERLKETIPFYSTRHFVKPGVTGWAQVCYPYGATDEDALEKLRYDLFYIKNYSIFLDFKIIIDTIRVVLTGFGGR